MKLSPKAQSALDLVIEKMKTGDLSPVLDVALLQRPDGFDIPSDKWTFSNRFLAYIQTGDFDCRGFRQWQDVGRQVQKGKFAAFILAPLLVKCGDDDDDKKKLVGFRPIPVFPVSATEGDSLPSFDLTPVDLPPLFDVAKKLNVSVEYLPSDGIYRGYFNSASSKIVLCTYHEKTFFHELAHAAHSHLEIMKPGQDPRQEIIAEFTACVLSRMFGRDYTGNAWEYLKIYNDDPLIGITQAMTTIEQVINLILEKE